MEVQVRRPRQLKANGFKQLVLADRLSCAIFPISSGTAARQRQRFACPRLRPSKALAILQSLAARSHHQRTGNVTRLRASSTHLLGPATAHGPHTANTNMARAAGFQPAEPAGPLGPAEPLAAAASALNSISSRI